MYRATIVWDDEHIEHELWDDYEAHDQAAEFRAGGARVTLRHVTAANDDECFIWMMH